MGERIKDLVYDFSDIIISLIIITLIFGVVSWKISDSMAYNSFTDEAGTAAAADNNQTASTNDNSAQTTTGTDAGTNTTDQATTTDTTQTGGKPAASDNTTNAGSGNTTTTDSNQTTPPANTNTTPPATTTTNLATTAPAGDFKVEIPSGSSGLAIAKILKEKGIISDTKMFITRVDQLKMGSKLKAGSFTIKSGSTLDDVIYTLTGKK